MDVLGTALAETVVVYERLSGRMHSLMNSPLLRIVGILIELWAGILLWIVDIFISSVRLVDILIKLLPLVERSIFTFWR